jgi:holo-[acyl-carrier protein] synthase
MDAASPRARAAGAASVPVAASPARPVRIRECRVVGVGVDLVEVRRVATELARDADGWCATVLTPDERVRIAPHARGAPSAAATFAAKEAVFKALALESADLAVFREIAVRLEPAGRGRVELAGRLAERARTLGVTCVHLSWSSSPRWATALAVLEGGATTAVRPARGESE